MTLLLGKLPARHDDRTLKLSTYAPSSGFVFPKTKSWAPDVPSFPMLANDRFGDCVFAGAYHQIQLWLDADGVDVVPAEADTLQAYSEVTGFNPNDPSTDRGANLLDVLNFWRKTGMPWTVNGTPMRHEIAGYAKIQHTNHAEAKLAIAEFGGAYLGVNLPLAAQAQFGSGKHWTVGRGPNSVPGSWGGHCVVAVGYNATTVALVTWGKIQFATYGWLDTYADEMYAILSTDWTGGDDKSPSQVDFAQLKTDIGSFR